MANYGIDGILTGARALEAQHLLAAHIAEADALCVYEILLLPIGSDLAIRLKGLLAHLQHQAKVACVLIVSQACNGLFQDPLAQHETRVGSLHALLSATYIHAARLFGSRDALLESLEPLCPRRLCLLLEEGRDRLARQHQFEQALKVSIICALELAQEAESAVEVELVVVQQLQEALEDVAVVLRVDIQKTKTL